MRSLLFDIYNALLVPRYRYTDSYSQFRARATLTIALILVLVLLSLLVGLAILPNRDANINAALTRGLVLLLAMFGVFGLIHAGQLRAGLLLMYLFMLLIVLVGIPLNGVNSNIMLAQGIPLAYSALVLGLPGVLVTLGIQILVTLIVGILHAQGISVPINATLTTSVGVIGQTVLSLIFLVAVGFLCATLASEMSRMLRYGSRLLTQLRAGAEIAQIAAFSEDREGLLQRVVNYLRDRFGFYYVQVFLMDAERRYANLVAGTGETGEMLLQRGYRLAINSQSNVGQAIQSGEPIMTNRDSASENAANRRTNELLREMRSELAIPLVVGDQVIGALNVQSTRPNAFSNDLLESLRILSNQISVAIFTAQQLDERTTALSDMRRQFLETEVSLREANRLNQRLTGKAWEDYLRARSSQIIGYTLTENRLQRDVNWTPSLTQAAGNRRAVITTSGAENERQVVAVPIELRGRAIGAIEVELMGSIRQADTLEVLQSVAQRLALSIDNARLFEQAQELAQRELEVNAISATLQGINDVNDLARTAVQELGRALGAPQAAIRLGLVEIDARDSRPKPPEGLKREAPSPNPNKLNAPNDSDVSTPRNGRRS